MQSREKLLNLSLFRQTMLIRSCLPYSWQDTIIQSSSTTSQAPTRGHINAYDHRQISATQAKIRKDTNRAERRRLEAQGLDSTEAGEKSRRRLNSFAKQRGKLKVQQIELEFHGKRPVGTNPAQTIRSARVRLNLRELLPQTSRG